VKTLSAVCFALCVLGSGCSWERLGRDLGKGLAGGVQEKADTIGGTLVRGVRDTLTAPETRQELETLIDELGRTLAEQARATRDTLLGDASRAWVEKMRDSLLGARTRRELAELRTELIGTKTKVLLAALRTEILGDSSRTLLAALRNELLGPETKAALAAVIDTAMVRLAVRFRTDVKPLLEQELSFIQKNASTLLILLAVLCCGVIAFIYRKKASLSDLVQTLTYQIHLIPDQGSYDELVERIQRSVQEKGQEPLLRKLLGSQGILGKEAWRPAAGQARAAQR
jgi:hypothetical protein